jgi:FAD/FMN-containing dehydrogenase
MVESQELKQVPDTPAEMAEMLRRASEKKLSVVLRGAGTKLGWDRPPQRVGCTV